MSLVLKKFIFLIFFNLSLLSLLIVGIQNSKEKNKINFIVWETVNLPVSFIIGSSFISGSIIGSIFRTNKKIF